MAKNKASNKDVLKTANKQKLVNTENEFAAEFGEGLYGGQARVSYQQQQEKQNSKASK